MPNITLLPAAASTPPNSSESSNAWKDATPEDVLDDLSSRFILNLPPEEHSVERICFQIEQAHWYYEDFIREANPRFPSLPLKRFTEDMFHHCPSLKEWRLVHETAYERFLNEKIRVPVCGAIMLNDTWDKCVLVKGWKQSSGWGFPKGKINQDERRHVCAAREVLEETGYDLSDQINPDHVIEMTIKQQNVSLYIVPGIPEDFPFETKTRKEISKIEWFNLADLPTWRRSKASPGKFYLITPFIVPLKSFIAHNKPRNKRLKKSSTINSMTPTSMPPLDPSAAQESSSQSSDPLTPSPQYTEPMTYVAEPSATQPEAVDPHLARLLSNLGGLGVATPSEKSISPKHTQILDSSQLVRPSSVHNLTKNSPISSPNPVSQTQTQSRPTSAWTNTSHQSTTPTKPPPLPPSSPSAALTGLTPPNVLRSRRISTTTDISPYLSRPSEVPTSARNMRRLALLESVAQQSERSVSAASFPPSRPQSLAPPSFSYDRAMPMLYSTPQTVLPAAGPYAQGPPRPYSVMEDPFQVRPRHGGMFPQNVPSSQSMGHGQLLALINSQRSGLPPIPDPHPSASYFPNRSPFPTYSQPMGVISPSNPNFPSMPMRNNTLPSMPLPPALVQPAITSSGLLSLLNGQGGSYAN